MNISFSRHDRAQQDRDATIATLVAAFEGAAARCLHPAALDYHRHFPGFLTAFGGRAFEAGVVDRIPAGLAATLWFPPGVEPDGGAIMAHLEATIPSERLEMLAAGMAIQSDLHPQVPHWYLPWNGVVREAQCTGLGAALLKLGFARVDAEGMPAYLEATNRRNANLYRRFGFEVSGIVDAPGYPEIIAMWRPAPGGRNASAAGWFRV